MDKQMIEEMAEIALKNTLSYTCAKQIAMNFYNAGYRKIPENAVVLTREDYDYLIKDCQRWETLAVEKVDEINKIEKETAKKFAEMAKAEAHYTVCDTRCVSVSRIDEICKEIVEGKKDGT